MGDEPAEAEEKASVKTKSKETKGKDKELGKDEL